MICTKCGAANRPGAKFCDECGQSLKPAVAEAPIPGPHPGMRYRRSAPRGALPEDAAQPSATPPPKREPAAPPPRREPPPAAPKREAEAPVRKAVSPKQETASRRPPITEPASERVAPRSRPAPATPPPRKRQMPVPDDEPGISAEPLHRRMQHEPDVEITTPEPKRRKRGNGSGDHDNATIMIVLALVFFAILAVGASGVYFNLRESRPDLMREKAERAEAARNRYAPLEENAKFELPPQPEFKTSAITPDPPAVPPIPDDIVPQSNPAIPEPAAVPERARVAKAESRQLDPQLQPLASTQDEASGQAAQNAVAFSDAEVNEMLNNPNTSAGKPESKAYKAQFRQLFGMVVIERTYPSMAMKQRALKLWTREQKILEPDGSINDKYAPERQTTSPIPGH